MEEVQPKHSYLAGAAALRLELLGLFVTSIKENVEHSGDPSDGCPKTVPLSGAISGGFLALISLGTHGVV